MSLYQRLKIDESGIGDEFGRWTQIGASFVLNLDGSRRRWGVVQCECGFISVQRLGRLGKLSTQCKACHNRKVGVVHGRSRSAEHRIWSGMKTRCANPNRHNFKHYGGRGIQVCERWRDSFEAFLEDMGPRPSPKHSIDRIDNEKGYSAENCRWATLREQRRNTRGNRLIAFSGETKCLTEWAEALGFEPCLLVQRLYDGWSIERAFTTPKVK